MFNYFVILLIIILCITPGYGQDEISEKTGSFAAKSSEASLLEIRTPENLYCDIRLKTHSSDFVEGSYKVWARAKNKEQQDRFINLIEVKLDERSGREQTFRVRVLAPKSAPWQGKNYSVGAELNISIPSYFKVESRSTHSDVYITGPLGYVEVDCEYGSVKVKDINGETNIRTSYADIDVQNIKGKINIESIYSDIKASDIIITDKYGLFSSSSGKLEFVNIKGPIEASTSNEDIIARDLNADNGAIFLRTSYGKIEGVNIIGELVAETSYQPIELKDVSLVSGVCKIENSYSPIDVGLREIGDTHLLVNNTYNAINLRLPSTTSGKLILNVDEGGRIHSKGLSIKPIVMDKTRLVGIVDDGLAKIEANVSGIGEINIYGD